MAAPKPEPCDTLFIGSIPPHSCSVIRICQHFRKFGHIKSVWCSPTTAVIKYSSIDAAKAAYESPLPYANNRFVTIRYHRSPSTAESNLSQLADMEKVKGIAMEVMKQIDAQKSETQAILTQMKNENTNNMRSAVEEIASNLLQCLEFEISLYSELQKVDKSKRAEILEMISQAHPLTEDTRVQLNKKTEEMDGEHINSTEVEEQTKRLINLLDLQIEMYGKIENSPEEMKEEIRQMIAQTQEMVDQSKQEIEELKKATGAV